MATNISPRQAQRRAARTSWRSIELEKHVDTVHPAEGTGPTLCVRVGDGGAWLDFKIGNFRSHTFSLAPCFLLKPETYLKDESVGRLPQSGRATWGYHQCVYHGLVCGQRACCSEPRKKRQHRVEVMAELSRDSR